jgi:DNA-binding beta-propeller fold protein YncE
MINTKNLIKYLSFAFLLAFTACRDDEQAGPVSDNGNNGSEGNYQQGLWILNEGNFDWGHGSITHWLPESEKVTHQIFEKANDRVLGNVVNSMAVVDDRAYVLVNNSDKIEVLSSKTAKSLSVIEDIISPRQIIVSGNTAYISSLYANGVYLLNLENYQSQLLPIPGWTESMQLYGQSLYVSNMKEDKIHRINTENQTLEISENVCREPESIQIDKNGYLWVLCTGGFSEDKPRLKKLNLPELEIAETYEFDNISAYPGSLQYVSASHCFYYLNSDVYRFCPDKDDFPAKKLIDSGSRNFYKLHLDKNNQRIILTDAKDYNSRGEVLLFDMEGNSTGKQITAGIIPSYVHVFD